MYEHLCRICAKRIQEKDATRLFDSENQQFLMQIKDLTGVRLKNNPELPKLLCCDCKRDLIIAYKFRENFLKVQASFKLKNSKGNKRQVSNGLVEATEFVQVFVKEEQNVLGDQEDIYEANEEKEINIAVSQNLNNRQNFTFVKDEDEINALELEPNEENTLEDTEFAMEEEICKKINDEQFKTAKNEDLVHKASDEKCIKKKKIVKTKKFIRKIKNTDKGPSENGNMDIRRKITKSRKKRKDSEEHSNIFICDQCGNHFSCRHHFKLHLRRHTGDKRCACELCPDKFFTSSELRRHMRRHTGERPFACKYCERRFTDYSTRIKHERTHTNERPFMCSQCGKSFTTSYILKNHMLTHTGERHFKCDVCNKAFTRRTHLVVHYRSIMHKQAVEKDKHSTIQENLTQSNCILAQSKHIPTFLV